MGDFDIPGRCRRRAPAVRGARPDAPLKPDPTVALQLAGEIGELVHVRSTFSHRLEDDEDIRLSAQLEGGSLMDVGCYCVSGARLIAREEPDLVYGQQVTTADGVDRRFTGYLHFPSGLVATFHSGFDSFSESLEVTGREGTVFLPDPWHSLRGVLVVDGEIRGVGPGLRAPGDAPATPSTCWPWPSTRRPSAPG